MNEPNFFYFLICGYSPYHPLTTCWTVKKTKIVSLMNGKNSHECHDMYSKYLCAWQIIDLWTATNLQWLNHSNAWNTINMCVRWNWNHEFQFSMYFYLFFWCGCLVKSKLPKSIAIFSTKRQFYSTKAVMNAIDHIYLR